MRNLMNKFLRLCGLRPQPGPSGAGDWDDRDRVLAEFPEDEWERVPTTDAEDARLVIAFRAMCKDEFVMAEARWFGPDEGMLFFPRRKREAAEA